MTVRILDEATVLRIAAGEVVERPASVVKELVENALDAGARTIEVAIRAGGIEEIVVRDDGGGIAPEDLPLVVARHATSKIACPEDLDRIATYGFRGEALAAIAEAADLEILSRVPGGGGFRLWREGADWRTAPCAMPEGTEVRVARLFARHPARRKFLSSPRGEAMRVAGVMERMLLARPDVAWRYLAEGETRIATSGGGLAEAARIVFGDRAGALLEVEGRAGALSVSGLVAPPDAAEKRKARLFFVVNGRPVESGLLFSAVRAAYETLLPAGRYPFGVLCVTSPPEAVDVNCHPAKREVRFRAPNDVFRAVKEAVRMRLSGARRPARFSLAGRDASAFPAELPAAVGPAGECPPAAADLPDASDTASAPVLFDAGPAVRVAGKIAGRYLVAEDEEGLVLVDLHAAHERVLFEKLLAAAEEGSVPTAPFLLPVSVACSPAAREAALAAAEDLARLGFEVEPFGPGGLLLRSIPAALAGRCDPAALLVAIAEELAADPIRGPVPPYEEIARRACHRAVRTGDPLTDAEAEGIVRSLYRARDPGRCPHGRPTMLRIPIEELDRRFGRTS